MSDQKNINVILSLINSSLHEEIDIEVGSFEIDWEQIFALAKKNQLVPILYDTVQRLGSKCQIPKEMIEKWKSNTMNSMLLECEKYRALQKILSHAKKSNITIVIFKGCVLADLYPKYLSRISSDTDIFIYQREKEKAIELLKRLGYQKDELTSKELVYNYILDSPYHKVELHFSLSEDYKGAKIDLMERMLLTNEESLINMNVCGMEITTLGYEEHIILQIFHFVKHFSLQGVSIRYLIDFTVYINKYETYLNLAELWKKIEMLNYDIFCENLFGICIQYLGLSSSVLRGRKIRVIKEVDDFLIDLINVGLYCDGMKKKWQLVGYMKPYFLGEQDIPKSKFIRSLKFLFPSGKHLNCTYNYAKKYIILLPIAWIHRGFRFLIDNPNNAEDAYNMKDLYSKKEKLILTEQRLSLMRSLGLAGGGKK